VANQDAAISSIQLSKITRSKVFSSRQNHPPSVQGNFHNWSILYAVAYKLHTGVIWHRQSFFLLLRYRFL